MDQESAAAVVGEPIRRSAKKIGSELGLVLIVLAIGCLAVCLFRVDWVLKQLAAQQ
jgi:hypothetical protein